ncbi:hypothetical protein M758_5G133200 [Ceratodon purpureus]|nr:hypothetical protein M758_5G133200 [Ceratodon purpureus]
MVSFQLPSTLQTQASFRCLPLLIKLGTLTMHYATEPSMLCNDSTDAVNKQKHRPSISLPLFSLTLVALCQHHSLLILPPGQTRTRSTKNDNRFQNSEVRFRV